MKRNGRRRTGLQVAGNTERKHRLQDMASNLGEGIASAPKLSRAAKETSSRKPENSSQQQTNGWAKLNPTDVNGYRRKPTIRRGKTEV